MGNIKLGKMYDEKFYRKQRENNISSAKVIVPLVLNILKLKGEVSIIDLGCGSGNWLSVFKKYGCKVTGVDGGEHISKNVLMISEEEFIQHDFRYKFKNDKKYTIAMSLEVAEHIPQSESDNFVKTLTKLSDIVLFSAAIPYQRGANHVNEQFPSYWINKFRKCEFEVVDCIRDKIWDNRNVRGFYAQNIFLFFNKKSNNVILEELSKNNRETMFDLVHPKVWNELNNYKFMRIIDKLHNNKIIYYFYKKII